nr:MAG TPA: Major capsid protein [Microviridae sp.]
MANKVLGMHRLKNKVNRNAFDLSHRHMFTAQIGELLPVFSQWVNPNETFKIGYNGKTRTAALNTDAFTRVRENIQYYFVPFQSLWKYFEQQVNNMTKGDSGENISKFASSSLDASKITTSLPYVSYVDLAGWLRYMFNHALAAVNQYLDNTDYDDGANAIDFKNMCENSSAYKDVFICDGYRLCRAGKLLMSLGYGNFTNVVKYDIFAMALEFAEKNQGWDLELFKKSNFYLDLIKFEGTSISNSPNLSIFPLLAYHKICNDHYRNKKWQPFEPWSCNIDYVDPTSNMNSSLFIKGEIFTSLKTSLIDLENSNLPIDYFTSVLPRAQYGDESAVPIGMQNKDVNLSLTNAADGTIGAYFNSQAYTLNDNLQKQNVDPAKYGDDWVFPIRSNSTGSTLAGFHGKMSTADASLKISALRSATALQKYKEIQNSNDPDFASQVLAHFGIKPKTDSRTSIFIGGDDKTLSINPQVNTNFQDGGEPEIKAIGIGDLSAGCKFTASTYGMIIGIYRAVPQLDYSRVGIDRNLFKTDATDFPIPEFDSIGMQTQYRCELSAPLIGLCKDFSDDSTSPVGQRIDMSVTYGYAPRYAELKSAFDYFEGGFLGSYSSWVTGYDQKFLSLWRRNLGSQSIANYGSIDDLFKCRPSLLYSIFVNQWSGTVNDDKLLIGSVNTCVAVRPFSMYGLPYSK